MASSTPSKMTRNEMENDRIKRQHQSLLLTQAKAMLAFYVNIYIVIYNLLSACLWGYIFLNTVLFLFRSQPITSTQTTTSYMSGLFTTTSPPVLSSFPASVQNLVHRLEGLYDYRNTGTRVKWTQTLAVLEVVHSLFGWVRSPVGTTAAQVYSRLWTVWAVVEAVPEVSLEAIANREGIPAMAQGSGS